MRNKKFKETMKNVSKTAEPVVTAAIEGLQDAKAAAEPLVETAKDVAKDVAKRAEPTLKAAEQTVKEAGKQLTAALSPEVYLEYDGKQVLTADLVERCKEDFKANNSGLICSCQVYVKPADGKAYYVINQVPGAIDL